MKPHTQTWMVLISLIISWGLVGGMYMFEIEMAAAFFAGQATNLLALFIAKVMQNGRHSLRPPKEKS